MSDPLAAIMNSGRFGRPNSKLRYTQLLTVAWIAAVLYWPVMELGGIQLRADYPCIIVVATYSLLFTPLNKTTVVSTGWLISYSVLMLVGTLYGSSFGYPVSPALVGVLKFFLAIVVWAQLLPILGLLSAMRLWLVLGLPAAVLAVLQVMTPQLVADLTVTMFSSSARTPTELLFGATGNFRRAVSVFESPVYAAVAFLFLSTCASILLVLARQRREQVFLLFSLGVFMLGGLATASATFLLGATMVLVLWVFRGVVLRPQRSAVNLVIFLVVLVGVTWILVSAIKDRPIYSEILYQVEKIATGRVFESRYGPDGILSEAENRLSQFVIVGLGGTQPPFFVGDSLFISLWLRTGVPGLAVFLVPILGLVVRLSLSWRDTLNFGLTTILLLLLATGLGAPVLTIPRFSEFVALAVAACLTRSLRRTRLTTNGRVS